MFGKSIDKIMKIIVRKFTGFNKIFQNTILSRTFEFPANNSKQLI